MTDAPGRITLWAIEAFLAAAAEGTVQGAAKRLSASASAISQQLSALENALGASLLDRSQRPLRLTPAGETFRRHGQAILNELAAARAAIGLSGLSGLASFRLGFIEDFEAELTPRLLSDLGQEWPGCQFLLETGPSHRLQEGLDERRLDLIIAADLGSATENQEVHRLLEEPFVAVLPRGRGARPFPTDLPLILYTARHHMGRQIADALARHSDRPAHRYELDSYHSILAMVSAGSGWTILTPLAVLHAARFRDRIELHPLPMAPFTRRIALSARRDVLGAMPADIASRLRNLLAEMIVAPVLTDHPWLTGGLKVISA
ncbi:MAG: LysR family transcriptional regulator [Rhodobacteraceae bacterium]|nr:LysR family transcriptional regulator [Paracoccaceae bacterium]